MIDVVTWDAREWLAGLIGCSRDELAVRSIDKYGDSETQVRYERAGEAVARLMVRGPIRTMGVKAGGGTWEVSVRIGTGSEDVHEIEVPETDEVRY
ncbi:MAG: hypothetical protein A2V84_06545 [Chloroflexi bacterium RBG_16_70_13]|nr:MAG: hypothetical protein A2V84_06545 [Chloroflexi bacterium RBG_16_70_13]